MRDQLVQEQPLLGGRLDIVLSERDCDNVNWGKRTTCTGREARDNNQSTTLQRDCDNVNWDKRSTCTRDNPYREGGYRQLLENFMGL